MSSRWTEAELELLRDTSVPLQEVADRLGRPLKGVYNQASRIGVRRYREEWVPPEPLTDRRQWAEEELAVLRDLSLTYTEVAQRTGRSWYAVKSKANRLGLDCRRYWSQPGYEPGADDYRGQGWRRIRLDILERDSYTCRDGGEYIPSGRGLVVHHEIPWRLRPVNDPRFLVTLCRSHHMQRPEHAWVTIPPHVEAQLAIA